MKIAIHTKSLMKFILILLLFFSSELAAEAQENNTSRYLSNTLQSSRARSAPRASRGMYKSQVVPNWFDENTRFWYINNLRDNKTEFILVDAEKGSRQRAFDHDKLAASLSKMTQQQYSGDQLPFTVIKFSDDDKEVLFNISNTTYKCDLNSYEISPSDIPLPATNQSQQDFGGMRGMRGQRRGQGTGQNFNRGQYRRSTGAGLSSPDGKWNAFIRDNNVYIQNSENGPEIQLSTDGTEVNSYQRLEWAPDSQSIISWRVEPGDNKEVYLIQSSPPGGGRAVLSTRAYALPGDKFEAYELNIFNVEQRKQIKPELERIDLDSPRPRWNSDGCHFTYQKVDRGHQRLRLISVNSHDGSFINIIDEKSDTFIWTAHTENLGLSLINYIDDSNEVIYVSETDGWRHLYLYDALTGKLKNQITKGQWLIRGIQNIDAEKRQIWFSAGGYHSEHDPYFVHYFRVNFDGTGLVPLTDGNGTHTISYSPDQKYIIDSYSRVDMPPQTELRRVSDGKLVCKLEQADISELIERGWKSPEVFVAKGRDGKTDIWGVIARPADFDPQKKYPVIESIYAGPQGAFVPKTFQASGLFSSFTRLGFIVVQIDGMGTAYRSKAFHDVCFKNLKDAGFPDRIIWHKAAAEKYPYYDISRLGIYGTSAGGQNSAAAVLFYPEFYKAAAAACGCHDNRMDKSSWNEQWMGYPVGPQYSESSNIDNAWRLQGKLFLIVGEMDTNVPPENTMRFVDALIKAQKDFDLLVIPGADHGSGGAYGQRRMEDFFVRNLQNIETPNRNAQSPVEATP
ncbi:MAG: prolyl oligopeptidase family serine peptidase [Sedimentisphaerales bacterium]|nr:prolyl oligopeptidase family serine peptidase [Sedimentisphaerales bacterium]